MDTNLKSKEMKGGMTVDLELTSAAFKEGETIPKKYTGDGKDVSPPLSWKQPPEETESLVLICDDPDAPVGVWDHWVVFNMPPEKTGMPEAVPAGSKLPGEGGIQGKNSWGRHSYNGPAPPKGAPHRYFFKIYALDKKLSMNPNVEKDKVESAMKGHILAKGRLMGKYQR